MGKFYKFCNKKIQGDAKMTNKKRMEVYEKYGGICAYCGEQITLKEMQVDHIYPRQLKDFDSMFVYVAGDDGKYHKSGEVYHPKCDINDIKNLNPACRQCNHYKRGETLEQYRENLKTLIHRCRKIYINKVAEDYGIYEYHEWNGKFAFEIYEENKKAVCG
jgi:5-methylcytosine-specific restriction endonuclease McrA